MLRIQSPRTTPSASHKPSLRRLPVAMLALVALAASGTVLAQSSYQPAGPIASALTPGVSYIALNLGTSDLSRPITAFGPFGGTQQSSNYSPAVGNYMANQNYGFGFVSRICGRVAAQEACQARDTGRVP
jgi:hypothetical protein